MCIHAYTHIHPPGGGGGSPAALEQGRGARGVDGTPCARRQQWVEARTILHCAMLLCCTLLCHAIL